MPTQKVKKYLAFLEKTPLHPQWFAVRDESKYLKSVGKNLSNTVIDIGCGHQKICKYIDSQTTYIGLDYFQTSKYWYKSKPAVFADAQKLPIMNECANTVLLLDVLEHLPFPDDCIHEISRILKPGGHLILQVPFLYPIHDAPLDFQRWTLNGLKNLMSTYGFKIKSDEAFGAPLECSALLINIALSKTIINWVRSKNPLSILAPLLPPVILFVNLAAWALSKVSPQDSFMPISYRLVCTKA